MYVIKDSFIIIKILLETIIFEISLLKFLLHEGFSPAYVDCNIV